MLTNYSQQKRDKMNNQQPITSDQWRGMNTRTVQATEKTDFNSWAEGLKKESEKVDLKLTEIQIQLCLDALNEARKAHLDILRQNVGAEAKVSVMTRIDAINELINTINT